MPFFPAWNDSPPLRRVFLRDMVLKAAIGVYAHEHGTTQRVRVNISFGVPDQPGHVVGRDDLSRTVSYERVVLLVRQIVAQGHVRLVETLAERIAVGVLADRRIQVIRIRIEKLDVFDDLDAVGVEIERRSAAMAAELD